MDIYYECNKILVSNTPNKIKILSEIWGFHSNEDSGCGLLGSDAMKWVMW